MRSNERYHANKYEALANKAERGSWQRAEYLEQAAELEKGAGHRDSAKRLYEIALSAYESCAHKDQFRKTESSEKVLDMKRAIKRLDDGVGTGSHRHRESALKAMSFVGIVLGFLFTILLFANSITGYSVLGMSEQSSMSLGVVFLIVALFGLVIFFRNRKN